MNPLPVHISYDAQSVSLFKENEPSRQFPYSKVWVNKQPLQCIKNMDLANLCSFLKEPKVKNGELYVSIGPIKDDVSLKIREGAWEKPFAVNQHLTGAGLILFLEKKLKRNNFTLSCGWGALSLSQTLRENGIINNAILVVSSNEKPVSVEKDVLGRATEGNKRFVDMEKPKTILISSEACTWRPSCWGLNLEGRCENVACEVFKANSRVVIPIGFCKWDADKNPIPFRIFEERCDRKCICNEPLKHDNILNLIFTNCIYKIEGKRENGPTFTRIEGSCIETGASFDLGEKEENVDDWIYLWTTCVFVMIKSRPMRQPEPNPSI